MGCPASTVSCTGGDSTITAARHSMLVGWYPRNWMYGPLTMSRSVVPGICKRKHARFAVHDVSVYCLTASLAWVGMSHGIQQDMHLDAVVALAGRCNG